MNNWLDSILTQGSGLEVWKILALAVLAILLGICVEWTYKKTEKNTSKNYLMMLILLPVAVCVVISLVNGNLGTGIAIAGAFSLVRFRSAPGNGKEIAVVFADMAIGLAAATGYVVFAILITLLLCIVLFAMAKSSLGRSDERAKVIKIDIPEDLNYEEVFEDIFQKYTDKAVLEHVKTTNLGSMFELRFQIILKQGVSEKAMIDDLRVRNGNLPISIGIQATQKTEL